jgi:hypothetical protein
MGLGGGAWTAGKENARRSRGMLARTVGDSMPMLVVAGTWTSGVTGGRERVWCSGLTGETGLGVVERPSAVDDVRRLWE